MTPSLLALLLGAAATVGAASAATTTPASNGATARPAPAASPARVDDGVRYLPDIHGRLAGARGFVPTNVCLRREGSEITQCAYTDSEGRFRLPGFGAVHPARPGDHDGHGGEYPDYWLELGTRTKATRRLWTVELFDRRHVPLHLDCDPARPVAGAAGPVYCERRSAP